MEGGYGDHRGDEEVRRSDWTEWAMGLVLVAGIGVITFLALSRFFQPSNKEQAWQNLLRAQEIYREASK